MRVCLVTTSQPSTNPRLVKEADALVEAGFQVHVVAAHWVDWATSMDERLLASRPWRMTFIDWRKDQAPGLFFRSRVRHWAARKAAATLPQFADRLGAAALSRIGPELVAAAISVPAELYIAHNLGALPVALAAGKRFRSLVGFDAEDLHSGQFWRLEDQKTAALTRTAEQRLLPQCAYVTASAPGICEAYREMCDIPLPTCVLNVFPLRDRPATFRPAERKKPIRLYWFSQTIGPDRGLEDAVGAMGQLESGALELHLRGKWQAGYEQHLRRLAQDCGVPQNLIVSHAPAPPSELVRLAADYDIGLALEPARSVNNDLAISNKIFSYLLAGNAVLATATRGQSWMAHRLENAAVLCEPGRSDSMAAALRPWLDDREGLESARMTAWRLGETCFNWDREKATFLDIVTHTLATAQAGVASRT